MKVKHLFLIIIICYILYLDIYTITHFDLYDRKPNSFEALAGISFIISIVIFILLFVLIIITKRKEINNFLNKKIL